MDEPDVGYGSMRTWSPASRAEDALRAAQRWAPEAAPEEAAVAYGTVGIGFALLAIFDRLEALTAAVERGR